MGVSTPYHPTPGLGVQVGSPWGCILQWALPMGSCFMQVPPQGTNKDSSQLGLHNEQKHRLAITVGCRAVFHVALVGLLLSGGNGVPSESSCLGHGERYSMGVLGGGLTFLFPVFRDGKGG